MALIEVDEAEYQRGTSSAKLLDILGANPETGTEIRRLIKKAVPNARIPEIDVPAAFEQTHLKPIQSQVEALGKQLGDFIESGKKKQTEDHGREWISTGRKALKDQGYTDEGIEQVETIIDKEGIPSYEAAAALLEKRTPRDEPMMPMGLDRGWNFGVPDDTDLKHKLLLKDPNKFKNAEISDFFREKHKANHSGFGR